MTASKCGFNETELRESNLAEVRRIKSQRHTARVAAGRYGNGYLGFSSYTGSREAGYRRSSR